MAQVPINIGTAPDDGTGDTLRAAFQKVNTNETELFTRVVPVDLALVAIGESLDASQEPDGVDNPLQIKFGAGFGTGASPIQLLSDGTTIFNEAFNGFVTFQFQFGRTGSGGTSKLFFRTLADLNDGGGFSVQAGASVFSTATSSGVNYPESLTLAIVAEAGYKLKQELIRDGEGANDGGFFRAVAKTGTGITPPINPAPSASILFFKSVTAPP